MTLFKMKYKRHLKIGYEYFEGSCNQMIKDISSIIINYDNENEHDNVTIYKLFENKDLCVQNKEIIEKIYAEKKDVKKYVKKNVKKNDESCGIDVKVKCELLKIIDKLQVDKCEYTCSVEEDDELIEEDNKFNDVLTYNMLILNQEIFENFCVENEKNIISSKEILSMVDDIKRIIHIEGIVKKYAKNYVRFKINDVYISNDEVAKLVNCLSLKTPNNGVGMLKDSNCTIIKKIMNSKFDGKQQRFDNYMKKVNSNNMVQKFLGDMYNSLFHENLIKCNKKRENFCNNGKRGKFTSYSGFSITQ